MLGDCEGGRDRDGPVGHGLPVEPDRGDDSCEGEESASCVREDWERAHRYAKADAMHRCASGREHSTPGTAQDERQVQLRRLCAGRGLTWLA